jgi:hypothetical protein
VNGICQFQKKWLLFGKKYIIPYQQTYFIPERIFKCQVGINMQSHGYKEGLNMSYQLYLNGRPNAIVTTTNEFRILTESVIARRLGWTDFEKQKHGMWIDGTCSEKLYEVLDSEFTVWTSRDGSCWSYDAWHDCDRCGNMVSPKYNSAKVQPSYAHFRKWIISTIKEVEKKDGTKS